mmetsp:Transcript_3550/g.7378  ORF Transcript_3550/g.7378 Transcript_3550/m.7378 type:complete len:176 (+) Transcript_3550:44-571(+)
MDALQSAPTATTPSTCHKRDNHQERYSSRQISPKQCPSSYRFFLGVTLLLLVSLWTLNHNASATFVVVNNPMQVHQQVHKKNWMVAKTTSSGNNNDGGVNNKDGSIGNTLSQQNLVPKGENDTYHASSDDKEDWREEDVVDDSRQRRRPPNSAEVRKIVEDFRQRKREKKKRLEP